MDRLKQYEVYVEGLVLAIEENIEQTCDSYGNSKPIIPLQYIGEELEVVKSLLNKGV